MCIIETKIHLLISHALILITVASPLEICLYSPSNRTIEPWRSKVPRIFSKTDDLYLYMLLLCSF